MVRPFTVAVLLFAVSAANAQPHLVFYHKIGDDWPRGSSHWMSFVAISSDGQIVAGDSTDPDHLGFWTFPEGKFLRTVDGSPLAMSSDFRYLALPKQILDTKSGKPVLTLAMTGTAWMPQRSPRIQP